VDNPNVCPVGSGGPHHARSSSSDFQGHRGTFVADVSSADSNRGPVDEQRTGTGYPQLRQAYVLRFPHYPQFFGFLGRHGWTPPVERGHVVGNTTQGAAHSGVWHPRWAVGI